MSRHGKIARLPHPIREELNHRLENGEPGKRLIDWLNTLPEVAALLAADFDGRPISEQNLSDWKRGGFVEWQLRRDLMYDTADYAADSAAFAACGIGAGQFLAVLNARFAANLHAWDGSPNGAPLNNLRILKYLYSAVLALRRAEQQNERLALDRERLAFAREKEAARPHSVPKASPPTADPSPATPPSPATTPIQPAGERLPTQPTPATSEIPPNPTPSTPSMPSMPSAPPIPTASGSISPQNPAQNREPALSPITPEAPAPSSPPASAPAAEPTDADWVPDEDWATYE